jgi:hypothetical protein
MTRTLLTAALLGTVGSLIFGGSSTARAQGAMPNRVIQLEEMAPVPGNQGHLSPSAHVFIFQQGDRVKDGDTFLQFTVNNLPWQAQGDSYSLYAYTPTLPRCHVATFNTSGASFGFSSFAFLCDERSNPAWLTDPVWLEIYVEKDDGLEAPDTGAIPILYGYSAVPEQVRRR